MWKVKVNEGMNGRGGAWQKQGWQEGVTVLRRALRILILESSLP